jgi:multicomponent Na+:H+ antiporter subunit G
MIDWIAALLLVSGGFFCFVAGVGLVRLKDIYARMHAATKAGTLGLALIALAMMITSDTPREVLEPLFVFLFMIATAPVGSHLIGRSAFRTGIRTSPNTRREDRCGEFVPAHLEGE